ncbi:hypothetical protein [Faecalimonas sp.]
MNKRPKLNIQIFAEGGAGGEPTPGAIEVPEYISTYVSGIEDEGQRGYLETMSKDEQGLNTLKSFIKDPNADWNLTDETYKETIPNASDLIKQVKDSGYNEQAAKIMLDQRVEYLKTQKSLMSKEELAAEPNIKNFIATEKNVETQQVYASLSENAAGRRILLELMKLKGGEPTPGLTSNGGVTNYDQKTFIETFNKATRENDRSKLLELENFARKVKNQDAFYYDFMLLDK